MTGQYCIKRPTSVGILSRGKDYSVKDLGTSAQGYTNLLRKELGVSLDAERGQTRWTQLHELAHVKHSLWSPDRIQKRMAKAGKLVSVPSILAAEDARINELMTRAVPDAHKGFRLTSRPEELRRDLHGYVASHASPKAFRDNIRPSVNPQHAAAVDKMLARLKTMSTAELGSVLRVTVPLAQEIDRLQSGDGGGGGESQSGSKPKAGKGEKASAPPSEPTDEESESGSGDGSDDFEEDFEDDGGNGKDGEPEPAPGNEPGGDGDGRGEPGDDDAPGDDEEVFGKPDAGQHGGQDCTGGGRPGMARQETEWAIPTVVEPELTVALRGGNFQVTTAETGTAVRWAQLHRIATDGVVFRRNRRRPGTLQRGTVLIDASGSMDLSDELIERMVEMLPHATIAIYSGNPSSSYRRMASGAWVVVVARNGRRVATIRDRNRVPRGGENMCDGPALLWLSRQATPRLWICDGMVTGINERGQIEGRNTRLSDQCATIMTAAGIIQVCGHRSPGGKNGLQATRTMKVESVAAQCIADALPGVLRDVERGRI